MYVCVCVCVCVCVFKFLFFFFKKIYEGAGEDISYRRSMSSIISSSRNERHDGAGNEILESQYDIESVKISGKNQPQEGAGKEPRN